MTGRRRCCTPPPHRPRNFRQISVGRAAATGNIKKNGKEKKKPDFANLSRTIFIHPLRFYQQVEIFLIIWYKLTATRCFGEFLSRLGAKINLFFFYLSASAPDFIVAFVPSGGHLSSLISWFLNTLKRRACECAKIYVLSLKHHNSGVSGDYEEGLVVAAIFPVTFLWLEELCLLKLAVSTKISMTVICKVSPVLYIIYIHILKKNSYNNNMH